MNNWDRAAEEYSRLINSPDNLCYRTIIDSYLKKFFSAFAGGRLLDLGCGDGYLSRLLPAAFSVNGIDSSAELIKIAEEKNSPGEFLVGDITQEMAASGDCDFAVSNMVLMSVKDVAAVYRNSFKRLKTGGWLIATVLHPVFSRPTTRWFKTWLMKILRRDPFARIDGYGKYFEKDFPILGLANSTPLIQRPLADYLQPALEAGFNLRQINEFCPTLENLRQYGQPAWLAKFPMVMALVWQK